MRISTYAFGAPVMALAMTVAGWGAVLAAAGAHETAERITARTSARQAVMVAEQQSGSRAFEVDLEGHTWQVQVISKDGQLSNVVLDSDSGKLMRIEPNGPLSKIFDRGDQQEAAKLKDVQLTLAGAMAAAEQQSGAKAIEAGFEAEDGPPHFQVTVAKGSVASEVTIDANTGQAITDNTDPKD